VASLQLRNGVHRLLFRHNGRQVAACKGSPEGRALWDAYTTRPWTANKVTFYLCGDVVSSVGVGVADELEEQLRALLAVVGIEEVRRSTKFRIPTNGPLPCTAFGAAA
jgi:hypothetical protein